MLMWKKVIFCLSFRLSFPFLHRYGHGYELFCVASNPDGSLLASACKVCISCVASDTRMNHSERKFTPIKRVLD